MQATAQGESKERIEKERGRMGGGERGGRGRKEVRMKEGGGGGGCL